MKSEVATDNRSIEKKQPIDPNGEGIFSQLTTDSVTARKLLDALEAFDNAPGPIQNWYVDVIKMFFQRAERAKHEAAH